MTPRSLLAITDFSPNGDHALARAAQLCIEHGATLKLLCVAFPGEPPPADAACRLAHHALQLGQRHGVDVRCVSRLAHSSADIVASAGGADLLVWGTAPVRGLRSFLMGPPVERVLRQCQRPVLVVRRPAEAPYRSLLVAVDLSPASRALVALGSALHTEARVELFHAISTAHERKLRYADVPERTITSYLNECRRDARDRMFQLTDSYDARRNRVLSTIGHGSPARQVMVQQQRGGAELIVVGKHPASSLSDLLFGSTSQRLLRDSSSDVLVVPHDSQQASGARALTRLAAHPGEVRRRLRAGAPQAPARPNPAALPARAGLGTRR